MTDNQDKIREAFEARFNMDDHTKGSGGYYASRDTSLKWVGYQAAYTHLSDENARLREALELIRDQYARVDTDFGNGGILVGGDDEFIWETAYQALETTNKAGE